MGTRRSDEKTIDDLADADLTGRALAGELKPAFEIDGLLDAIGLLIAAGRAPILVGKSGVGKTAAVHDLARRAAAGSGPPQLRDRRILQFSFGRWASSLAKPAEQIGKAMEDFVAQLLSEGSDIVPFFCDMDLAYRFDLERQLLLIATQHPAPILGEGSPEYMQLLFDHCPEMHERFQEVRVEEPDYEACRRILEAWAADQADRGGKRYTRLALEHALELTHRFLARGKQPRKSLDLLVQLGAGRDNRAPLTESEIFDHFCSTYRTPRFLVDPSVPLDMANLAAEFNGEVLGQPEAVDAVCRVIAMIKAGLADPRRPFGAFLFAGPTGVGKTHLAQVLTEKIFGSRDRMARLNMADYPGEEGPEQIFGGQMDPGVLTKRLAGRDFGVLLLDEFEKANNAVHDRFLELVDEGQFVNGFNATIVCRSWIVIATTNTGAEVYRGGTFGFAGATNLHDQEREVGRKLEEQFRLELLNRFDRIIHFHPLSREAIRTIALRELASLKRRGGIWQRELEIEVDEAVVDWLTTHGYDPDFGARFLRRITERHVTTALADTIVRQNPARGSRIALTVHRNRIEARVLAPPGRTKARREAVVLPLGTIETIRKLDRKGLLREAARIVQEAQSLVRDLEEKKGSRSELLARMNEPSLWQRKDEWREVLERFRELDVAVRMEERYAAPLVRLRDLVANRAEAPADLSDLPSAVENAADGLRRWVQHAAEEGAGAVWMVLSGADPTEPAHAWLRDLASMELAWSRRLGLEAEIAAFELGAGEPTRVVLEVEGPGAASYLAMEAGIHRLSRAPRPDLRAGVEIVSIGPRPLENWPKLTAVRARTGVLGVESRFRAVLELPLRGLVVTFLGPSRGILSHLAFDLARAWAGAPGEPPETARVYGRGGRGAEDPRTGVVAPRLRDTLKGDLDRFLEGWRRRPRADPSDGVERKG